MLSTVKANDDPAAKLAFKCVEKSECLLAPIWNGSNQFGEDSSEVSIPKVAMTKAPARKFEIIGGLFQDASLLLVKPEDIG